MTDATTLAKVGSKLREWRENPVTFVREVFGVEPDLWQADVLNAFPTHQRLALKACKGPGKSCVMAWCGWNFLLTRPHPKVIGTSISSSNLRDGLWTEFAKWQGRSKLLQEAFTWSAERIVSKEFPETWFASARAWSVGADPTQQANTLAGIHADYVLFLVDEAGGIPSGVVAAAEAGLSTGIETKLFLSGNPTHLSGPLYDACTKERHLYYVKEITGDPDAPDRAPRIDPNWARKQIESYGRDSPWVLVNVFGQFPPGQDNTLIGVRDAEEAAKRVVPYAEYAHMPKILGVDVARFGDDRTTITMRQGKVAYRPSVFRNLDTMEVAGQVASVIVRNKPKVVFIDQTGIGSGVVDRLKELGYPVVGVDASARPADVRCLNMRAQMWLHMAEWVKGGGSIANDPDLIRELTTPTYKFHSDGKMQIESKADIKKRGLPSPDLADGLGLTFAYPVAPDLTPIENLEDVFRRGANGQDYDPLAMERF